MRPAIREARRQRRLVAHEQDPGLSLHAGGAVPPGDDGPRQLAGRARRVERERGIGHGRDLPDGLLSRLKEARRRQPGRQQGRVEQSGFGAAGVAADPDGAVKG